MWQLWYRMHSNENVLSGLKWSMQVMLLQTLRTLHSVRLFPHSMHVGDTDRYHYFLFCPWTPESHWHQHRIPCSILSGQVFRFGTLSSTLAQNPDCFPWNVVHCASCLLSPDRQCVLCCYKQLVMARASYSGGKRPSSVFSIWCRSQRPPGCPCISLCVFISYFLNYLALFFLLCLSPSSTEAIPVLMFEVNISPAFKGHQCYGWPPYEK